MSEIDESKLDDFQRGTLKIYRTTVESNPYLFRQKLEPKQFAFLTHPAFEILYGGAAGGMKSYSLVMAALQFFFVKGYSALLLRRTFQDLKKPKALIDLSHMILAGTGAKWNGQDLVWTSREGARLSFGYLDSEDDKYRYQGAEYHGIFFDELTQFTESQYLYMHSRLRRTKDLMVPIRVRAATNPGGDGHTWVKNRFINAKTKEPKAVFIPANANDNPYLNNDEYQCTLGALDRVTKAQLRDGNWDITASGGVFYPEYFKYRYQQQGGFYRLGSKMVPVADCVRFAAADIAGTEVTSETAQKANDPDYTVVGVWDRTPTGELVLVHLWKGRQNVPEVEEQLCRLYTHFGVQYAAVEKNGIGLPVVQAARRRGLAVRSVLAKRNKEARAQAASILMENGQVWLPQSAPWLEGMIDEMLSFPQVSHDDQCDMVSIACQQTSKIIDPRRSPEEVEILEGEQKADAEAAKRAIEEEQSRYAVTAAGDFGWYDLI